jgi:hypothetical protein
MQIRISLAAVLLSCSAIAQDKGAEAQWPLQTFDPKPWKFDFAKPPVTVKPSQPGAMRLPGQPVASGVCSIPLTNVTPRTPVPKMPVIPVDPNGKYAMKFVNPPAPSCENWGARKQQVPDPRP